MSPARQPPRATRTMQPCEKVVVGICQWQREWSGNAQGSWPPILAQTPPLGCRLCQLRPEGFGIPCRVGGGGNGYDNRQCNQGGYDRLHEWNSFIGSVCLQGDDRGRGWLPPSPQFSADGRNYPRAFLGGRVVSACGARRRPKQGRRSLNRCSRSLLDLPLPFLGSGSPGVACIPR